MATPYDSAGSLLGLDPQELAKLIAQVRPLMEQFQPNEADRRDANTQALITAGLSMLGTRKGQEWDRLGYAGMNALDAKGASLAGAAKSKRDQLADATSAMDMIGKLRAQQQMVADQKALGGIFGGGAAPAMPPGALPAGAAGPPVDPASIAPTANVEQSKVQQYRAAAAMYAARGNVDAAKKYSEIADKMEEEYSTTPQVVRGADGQLQLVQFSKSGKAKPVSGMTPAEKLQFVPAGGTTIPSDPYTGVQAGPAIPMTMTPGETASNAVARGNLDVARQRLAIEQGNQGPSKAADLRKEFNGLPQVKAYGEVQPVLQSAREAMGTDTPAADLNLIYAAAKIFDPGSVVRESETKMTMDTASPAQKFMGYWNYVSGGGRLTPDVRKALMAEIDSRGRGYESGYKSARTAYEGVADRLGVPHDQVFIEPFATSPTPAGILTGQAALDAMPPKERAAVLADIAATGKPAASIKYQPTAGKQIVRTGTEKGTGRKVVEYSDGTRAYK